MKASISGHMPNRVQRHRPRLTFRPLESHWRRQSRRCAGHSWRSQGAKPIFIQPNDLDLGTKGWLFAFRYLMNLCNDLRGQR